MLFLDDKLYHITFTDDIKECLTITQPTSTPVDIDGTEMTTYSFEINIDLSQNSKLKDTPLSTVSHNLSGLHGVIFGRRG